MSIDRSKMDTYVDGKLVSEGKKDETVERLNFAWWTASDEEIAGAIQGTVKFLEKAHATRMEDLTIFTRLYGAAQAFGPLGMMARSATTSSPMTSRISFNLCSSVIETLESKVEKDEVIPFFTTNGGDWDIQLKAEQLSKFVEGCFYETKMHEKGVQAFLDAAVWRLGIVHIDELRDRIFVERAFPHEFRWDVVEALTGNITQLHRVKIVERNVLLAQYPDKEDQEIIKAAAPAGSDELGAVGTAADLVVLVESHHLPSDPDAKPEDTDGLHTIVVGDQTLLRDPYTKSYFPYVFRRYRKALVGFDGIGCCERLMNLQAEINRLMILDQKSRWMMGSFKVLLEQSSKIVSQHVNNDIGALIRYVGTPPQYVTPPAIDPSNEAKLDSLIQKGYRQEGVSELEAASVKPMGVNSGKAMRTIANISDDRQVSQLKRQQDFLLECAFHMIEKARDIYKRKKSYKVTFPTTSFAEEIDWKDINLEKSKYVMRAFPKSSLADDLAGRLSDIQEYMQAGLITPRAGRRLMRKPDVEMADKLAYAAEDLLHKIYWDILSGKDFRPPEPWMDLQLALELGLEYSNYGALHNCPPDRLSAVDQFMRLVREMPQVAATQAPALPTAGAPGVPGAPPQAVPQAPPVSELLPNAPGKVAA